MATINAIDSNIPIEIAKGGTNATSMSTSTGIVKYDGTRLVTSTTANIDSSNRMTNNSQPAFYAKNTSNRTNVTGDGTAYTVVFDTAVINQGTVFDGTSTFTAPVTGIYMVGFVLTFDSVAVTHTIEACNLVTTGATYQFTDSNPGVCRDANGNYCVKGQALIPMTATNTATVQAVVYNSTKTVGVNGAATAISYFYGYLVC